MPLVNAAAMWLDHTVRMRSLVNRIEGQVLALIAEKFSAPKQMITPRTHFRRDLGADSLAMVEFVMLLEAAFDVDVPDEEVAQIATVEHVITYLRELEDAQLG